MPSTQQIQEREDELHEKAYPDVPVRLPEDDWYGELKGLIEKHAPQRDLSKGDISCFKVRGPFKFPSGAVTGATNPYTTKGATIWSLYAAIRLPDGVFGVTYEVVKGPRDEP